MPAQAMTSASLLPPPPEVLEEILSRSAGQLDRLLLRFMNQVFSATNDGVRDDEMMLRLQKARSYYAQPPFLENPASFHLPPGPHQPTVVVQGKLADGAIHETTFDSRFIPRNPDYRAAYLEFDENRRIHLTRFVHRSPRPTLVFVHGWAAGYPTLEFRMFFLNAVYSRGYDVAYFTLPFHGPRKPRQAWFGGQLFPCPLIERTNEGFAHAIHDLRVVLDFIRQQGRGPIGLMGVSLGAYISTLLSGLGEALEFLSLMIPLADLPEFMWCQGERNPEKARAQRLGVTLELLKELFSVHAPLKLEPGLPPDRVLILAGMCDGICTRAQTEALWRHFDRPRVHWFPGSHVAYFRRAELAKLLADFADRQFRRNA